jgi:hypothetical protein
MKNIKKIILSTLLLTSCTTQGGNLVSSSNTDSSIAISGEISSSINSAQLQAEELKRLNQELDDRFKNKLTEQININGQLKMYKFLELKYASAKTIVRKKALNQMILNPRLDYYLNSKYLKDSGMQFHMIEYILGFNNIVFIPEDFNSGIRLPYVIILPEEKYKQDNLNYKSYAFFQMGGTPVNNQPYYSLLGGLIGNLLDKDFVFNTIPNELYSPKIVAFIPAPCLFNTKRNFFIGNRYLDRDNVYAQEGQFSDYRVCDEVYGDFDNSTDNPDTFNEYIYSQLIDIELQNKNIINQAIPLLRDLGYQVEDKVFMIGYSNNGMYTARFNTIYPEILKATYVGGTIPLLIPSKRLNNVVLNYPLGTEDHEELFGRPFDLVEYNKVPKLTLIGMNEEWSSMPLDRYDNIHTRYFQLYGAFGPSQFFSILSNFYNFGGSMLSVVNKNTGHYMSENDNKFIKDFFINNRNNEEPWYPSVSPYPEHIIITEKIQDPLLELVRQYPKRQA